MIQKDQNNFKNAKQDSPDSPKSLAGKTAHFDLVILGWPIQPAVSRLAG